MPATRAVLTAIPATAPDDRPPGASVATTPPAGSGVVLRGTVRKLRTY